jgi:hypothetical protein
MITETQKALLLKVRKQATSSFNQKTWTEALTALGFKVEVLEKEARKVSKVAFTTPGGATFTIAKKPGYRAIYFYDLYKLAKQAGADLVQLSCDALGLPSVDDEKKLHDLYIRDLTNTGTCGCCGGNFKRDSNGGLVNHGYERPGDGYLHGRCFGVGYQPWELASKSVEDMLAKLLRPFLAQQEKYLADLKAGAIATLTKTVSEWVSGRRVKKQVSVANTEFEFAQLLNNEIHRTEFQIRNVTADITRFEKQVAGWKLDDLPEVKHAGKFARAS